MIRGFRRLRGSSGAEKRISAPHNAEAKSEIATIAPKQIIRALYDYEPRGDDEMAFSHQDFLYVVDDSDPEWYVACNPLHNTSGLVPVSYFEVIQRQESIPSVSLSTALHNQAGASPTASTGSASASNAHSRSASAISRRTAGSSSSAADTHRRKASSSTFAIYGLVLYDFNAERNDELEAKADESIIIIAQSNEEWFVAKPIGRLGGPGLIPVSYVELREVGTDTVIDNVSDAIKRAGVPQVEEWKRRAAEYKASSIPLGRFDEVQATRSTGGSSGSGGAQSTGGSHGSHGNNNHQNAHAAGSSHQYHQPAYVPVPQQTSNGQDRGYFASNHTSTLDPENPFPGASPTAKEDSAAHTPTGGYGKDQVYVVQASIDRFAINGGRYWYLLSVVLSNGRYRNLCRYYQDFYDFQIKLLEEYPVEAGRTGEPRTLPYMPGPLSLVNHAISSQRRANLDDYVRNLIRMPAHISRSPLIQQLFAIRNGDIESDHPTTTMPQPPEEMLEHTFGNNSYAAQEGRGAQLEEKVVLPPNHTEGLQPRQDPGYASSANASGVALQQPRGDSSLVDDLKNFKLTDSDSIDPLSRPEPTFRRQHNPADSVTSFQSTGGTSGAGNSFEHIKVKVFYGNELIAIRIPSSLPFVDLYNRVASRLSLSNPELYKNQDFSGPVVDSEEAFHNALSGEGKIILYAR